ncbi:putative gnat family [Diaporthe ampelina]|uniref:Putative gnat family n=1 Tax=Diaporthe ampelina TaxID=1214573 RepID=A0A0G2FMB3_9PEZI|nr:putative gnat family [Diaporthe ampelina]
MANKSLQFRIAAPEDAAQIQNLIQSAFRAADTRAKWTGSAELASQFHISVDEVLASISKPDRAVLVATDPATGNPVASVEAFRRDPGLARLSMLAVDSAYQRGGLGRRVLARAEDHCRRAWGSRRLGLNALSTREELIAWYVRCGFRRTGETSAFPRERFAGLELPEDLCFVELEKDLGVVAEEIRGSGVEGGV